MAVTVMLDSSEIRPILRAGMSRRVVLPVLLFSTKGPRTSSKRSGRAHACSSFQHPFFSFTLSKPNFFYPITLDPCLDVVHSFILNHSTSILLARAELEVQGTLIDLRSVEKLPRCIAFLAGIA